MSSKPFARLAPFVLAAAAVAAGSVSAGCAAEPLGVSAGESGAVGVNRVARSVHFDLARQPGGGAYALEINGRALPLAAHDAASLAAYDGALSARGLSARVRPTHFVASAPFSTKGPQIYRVVRTEQTGLRVTVLAGIHLPPRAGVADAPLTVTAEDTAVALAFQDPSLMTLDTDVASRVIAHIKGTSDFARLVSAIETFGPATSLDEQAKHHSGWAVSVISRDAKGAALSVQDPKDGSTFQATHWVTAGSPEYYAEGFHDRYVVVDGKRVVAPTPYAMAALVRGQARVALHDDAALLGKMFTLQTDTTTRPLTARGALGAEGTLAFALDDTQWKGDRKITIDHAEGRKVTFSVHNGGWRRQAVAVRFRDVDGKLIAKKDIRELPESEAYAYLNDSYAYSTIVGVVDGRFTVLGVPLSAETVEKYEVELPPEASSFEAIIGSAGMKEIDTPAYVRRTGGEPEPTIALPGEVATGLLDVALPLMALAAGAGTEHLTKANPLVRAVAAEGVEIGTSLLLHAIASGQSGASMFNRTYAYEFLTDVIAKSPAIATALLEWSIEVSAEKALEAPLEMFAAILEAIEVAGTLVQIGETVGTVALNAPLVYDRVAASETVDVQIAPKAGWFSPYTSKVATYLYFGHSTVPTVQRQAVDMRDNGGNGPRQIHVVLPQQPVGGEVKVKVALESDTGWVAGAGEAELANTPNGANTLVVPIAVEQNPVPIDASTRYRHDRVLTVDPQGKHVWQQQSAPPSDVAPTICDTRDTSRPWLCGASSMTFDARGALGYAWTASGTALHTCDGKSNVEASVAQTINVNPSFGDGTPDARLQRSACGSLAPVFLAFDPSGRATGGHVFVQQVTESVKGGTRPVYEVFPLEADKPGPIAPEEQTILGRFRSAHLDAIVMSPEAGVLLGLDKAASAVEVLRIGDPAPVAKAPTSTVIGGAGTSIGRLHDATALAFLPAGAGFLVLEAGRDGAAGRVQAFTFDGASAPLFGGSAAFALDAEGRGPVTYTDMKIDPTESYVYVSSYVGAAPAVADYRLDIYRMTDGALVSRTTGVPATKIAIDTFRDVYTLNPGRITPSLPEPGVSLWVAPPVEGR